MKRPRKSKLALTRERYIMNRTKPMIPSTQIEYIMPAICLNISSSMQGDSLPHISIATPQTVATQWQMMPARKIPSVLRVRHTSPHGQILFMQQSMTPNTQRMESRKVPPQTKMEPQKMKLRKCSLEGSWQLVVWWADWVTQATTNRPKLLSWAGMLNGSRILLTCILIIIRTPHIIMDSLKYRPEHPTPNPDRWGLDTRLLETDLLAKKDQQIKRLLEQLEAERRRADNALRMLESFRGAKQLEEDNAEGMKSEVSRRLKAEEEARRLRMENSKLKGLMSQHLQSLGLHREEMSELGREAPVAADDN